MTAPAAGAPPVTAPPAIEDLREELRAKVRHGLDRLVLVGGALGTVVQLVATHEGRWSIASTFGTLLLALCALGGILRDWRWTPEAYIWLLVAGQFVYLASYGPLAGLGAMYVFAATLGFVFLPPGRQFVVIAAIVAGPLVVGALCSLGAVEPVPVFRFADRNSWERAVVAILCALVATAMVVVYVAGRLRASVRETAQALELELAARRQQAEVAQELSRARRADLVVELAADVGADIAAALAIVSARAQELANELAEEEARACLADVIAAATTAGSTMGSLAVFRTDASDVAPTSDAVKTVHALPKIVRRMLPPGVRLDIAAESEARIALSSTDLLRVLTNLVLNARDAIAEIGTIRVQLTASPASITIEVRDDGAGMDETTLAKVFQPFFTTKPVGRGTGLGLATAKVLVERAGGTIAITSKLGAGTTLRIELPRCEA